jgi:replicative DNA helicase
LAATTSRIAPGQRADIGIVFSSRKTLAEGEGHGDAWFLDSLEAMNEQSLLGALMLDNQAWERVADVITSRDFYKGNHRVIYEHIELVLAADQPADVVTVSESMQAAACWSMPAGRRTSDRWRRTPQAPSTSGAMPSWCARRRFSAALCALVRRDGGAGLNPGRSRVGELLEDAESKLFDLERAAPDEATADVQADSVEGLRVDRPAVSLGPEGNHRDSTGFSKLDMMTAGMQPGDLHRRGWTPEHGEDGHCNEHRRARRLNRRSPSRCSRSRWRTSSLVQRMLGSVGRVDQHKLRTGMLHDDDWVGCPARWRKLHDSPFIIEETTSLSIIELRARARRLKRETPLLALIVVDYLGLMASKAQTQSERTQEISEISRGMKALAKELEFHGHRAFAA